MQKDGLVFIAVVLLNYRRRPKESGLFRDRRGALSEATRQSEGHHCSAASLLDGFILLRVVHM